MAYFTMAPEMCSKDVAVVKWSDTRRKQHVASIFYIEITMR